MTEVQITKKLKTYLDSGKLGERFGESDIYNAIKLVKRDFYILHAVMETGVVGKIIKIHPNLKDGNLFLHVDLFNGKERLNTVRKTSAKKYSLELEFDELVNDLEDRIQALIIKYSRGSCFA
jgi:hypothetical protein